jgi:hypothetical protein
MTFKNRCKSPAASLLRKKALYLTSARRSGR